MKVLVLLQFVKQRTGQAATFLAHQTFNCWPTMKGSSNVHVFESLVAPVQ